MRREKNPQDSSTRPIGAAANIANGGMGASAPIKDCIMKSEPVVFPEFHFFIDELM
jgi:hypothetical protein